MAAGGPPLSPHLTPTSLLLGLTLSRPQYIGSSPNHLSDATTVSKPETQGSALVFLSLTHIQLVTTLKLGLDFAGGGMSLEVFAYLVDLAVIGEGGVAKTVVRFIVGIDKDDGMTADGSLPGLPQNIFSNCSGIMPSLCPLPISTLERNGEMTLGHSYS